MKFRIHFTVNDCSDYFEVEAETIEEIRDIVDDWFLIRGLDRRECYDYSEEL